DLEFFEIDGGNTFSELFAVLSNIHPGAALIGIVSLLLLVFWEKILSKKSKLFELIQGPFVVVVLGIIFYTLFQDHDFLSIGNKHMVSVPIPENATDFLNQFSFPNFSVITNVDVWVTAFTIALVASLETLLCVEASDKIDPNK